MLQLNMNMHAVVGDSEISYNWTEHVGDQLRHVLADTIVTIGGAHSYHIEAQMLKDEDIIFRVFEYGFGYADKNRIADENGYILKFPEPVIVYLYAKEEIPDEYTLRLDFGEQGIFSYRVPVVKFLNTTPEELTARKMAVLIPFELLKLRRRIERNRSPENLELLKNLIQSDILGCIEENIRQGNITQDDARRLKRLTHRLYTHIYAKFSETEEITMMTDESLMLDIDIIEKRHEEELNAKDIIIHAKDAELKTKDAELQTKDEALRAKEEENRSLKAQLKKLQQSMSAQEQ